MPDGWEERKTSIGRSYYVNHVTKSTQWDRPTQPATQSNGHQNHDDIQPPAGTSRSSTSTSLANGNNESISRRHSTEVLLNLMKDNCSPSRFKEDQQRFVTFSSCIGNGTDCRIAFFVDQLPVDTIYQMTVLRRMYQVQLVQIIPKVPLQVLFP